VLLVIYSMLNSTGLEHVIFETKTTIQCSLCRNATFLMLWVCYLDPQHSGSSLLRCGHIGPFGGYPNCLLPSFPISSQHAYSPTCRRRSEVLRSVRLRSPLDLVPLYFFHNAWYSFERRNKSGSLSCSFPCTNITISYKNRLMHIYVINTTLLALCHSGMFRLSKGHLQGVRQIHSHSTVSKICTRCKFLIILTSVVNMNLTFMWPCIVTNFL